MSSYSDPIAMRYPAPRQRSLSSLRTPSLLPDISENSPSRTPSPPLQVLRRPTHVRSVSVASFLSDGTIEIEGFGFDNISEIGDDASMYGGESIYADSVFDGHDNDNDNEGGNITRPHTPSDLSWRAERILANAKKKLDLCGQNISRARSSLILSPSTTPTSFHEQLDGMKAMPALHSHRFRFRNEGIAGNGSSPSNNGVNSHLRTNSESAVPSMKKGVNGSRSLSCTGGDGLGTIEDVDEHPAEVERPQSEQMASPSKSTQQMRALRDQMKDLRGKITNLQNQTRSDSIRRRSVTSLRSAPNPYEPQSALSADDPKAGDLSPVELNEIWENAEEIPDDYSSTRPGTPRAFRRSASPFEARHEDREDAFSYDALFYGNGIYAPSNGNRTSRPTSYSSDGTASTATVLEPPRIAAVRATARRDSFGSIESFATAAEDHSSSASSVQYPIDSTPPLAVPGEWLSPSPRDDGYHSAPHTPQSPYRESSSSLSSEATKASYLKPTPPLTSAANPTTYFPPIKSTTSTYTHESDTSIDARLTYSQSSQNSRHKSSISIGNAHIATAHGPSHDSSNSLLLTSADGIGNISLKLGPSDRELIEKMIEGLGTVCCNMETEVDERKRGEWRRRLEGALGVLRGEVVGWMPEGRRKVGGQQGLGIREEDVGESDDECF